MSQTQAATIPKVMMSIPVVYTMRGIAKVMVPITASEQDIRDIVDEFGENGPEGLDDCDFHDEGDWGGSTSWRPELEGEVDLLNAIGQALIACRGKHNITLSTEEYTSSSASHAAEEKMENNPDSPGFVYINGQDVEDALENNGCCIGFGAREDETKKHIAIAKLICQELDEAGLTYEWNGTDEERICVTGW